MTRQSTATTQARYDRNAPVYDLMQRSGEQRMGRWRTALWRRVRGPRLLEAGVGTGANLPFYPPGLAITAVDLSPRMLKRAHLRAASLGSDVALQQADIQALPFRDGSFETVVTTCVFCSVPDPVRGLAELRRVLAPGGQLLMLEHVLSHKPVLHRLMRASNPLVQWLTGANINRDTLANLRLAGFAAPVAEPLWLDIMLLIEAQAP